MSASETETNTSKKYPEAFALELTCPICLGLFSDPVSLPCGHIYCLACLQTMGKGLDQHSCPECQVEYQGTSALVKSYRMCSIVETYKATAGRVNPDADPLDVVMEERDDRSVLKEPSTKGTAEEESSERNKKDDIQIGSGFTEQPLSSDQDKSGGKCKTEMKEPKFKLASQVTELTLKLELAESVLKKEKEHELEVTTANNQLREKASELLEQVKVLMQSYSTQVMQLIEEELGPCEEGISHRISQASELTKQLRQAVLTAESLLTEEDEATFTDDLQTLQPRIMELLAKPVEEDDQTAPKVNVAKACPKLVKVNAETRERFREIQRSLRNTINPSEVTFDPETAHPNLVLAGDLKTVTFSATKQPYPPSPMRFTSFFQVLSTQSFFEGEHSWEVELEGSPWIIGICYSEKLARSGLPSALESSRSSWCLMWFNNLLTAFEQGHSVPLKRTTVSCRLEIRLSFKTHRLSFYNISSISGKTHVYTFKANLTEPVHLAYRMMSGIPNARVTIHS
ncbi:zinc-binding protein A33 [Xyrichtys novacula]|uniref:Zinc-binding protein A33 n=1 Tax=Xyrichtys novacula TaxID=13765 RepID=A0AAV1ES55_XYRNO|nr:zinc-binding protein A33 [Xyrichtys novacula]